MIHALAEQHDHPSNPLSSQSRALLAFHVALQHYPDGDNDRIRVLENERVPWNAVEDRFPVFDKGDQPLLLDEKIAREIVVNSWMENDKKINGRDPTVHVATCSARYKSLKTTDKSLKTTGTAIDTVNKAFLPRSCKKPAFACTEVVDVGILMTQWSELTRIPTCFARKGKIVERLYLSGNEITKIENLEKMTGMKKLDLHDNHISKIEGIDKLDQLEFLSLAQNKIEAIEGIKELPRLTSIKLQDNQIKKIENVDGMPSLQDINLENNQIREIEGIDAVPKLKFIYLNGNPGLPANACNKFNEKRIREGKLPIKCFQ